MSHATQTNRLLVVIALTGLVAACETVSGVDDFTVQGTSSDAGADAGAESGGDDSGTDVEPSEASEAGAKDGGGDDGADGPG